jgi:hypothetical protein
VHVPGASPADLALALGKDGKAYVLDRANLGGIGGQHASTAVSSGPIIGAPVAFTAPSGVYVVFGGAGRSGTGCPQDLAAIRLAAASPPQPVGAWCASRGGLGSPMVTSPDGSTGPLVWTVGAEGDGRLRAFDGETGEVVYAGGGPDEQMGSVRRYVAPIAARGRIYVAGDGRVYAFTTR